MGVSAPVKECACNKFSVQEVVEQLVATTGVSQYFYGPVYIDGGFNASGYVGNKMAYNHGISADEITTIIGAFAKAHEEVPLAEKTIEDLKEALGQLKTRGPNENLLLRIHKLATSIAVMIEVCNLAAPYASKALELLKSIFA